MVNIRIFKKRKIKFAILGIVVFFIGFAIFHEFANQSEKYPTSILGLEVAKASEIIELKNGDTLTLSIDIIQKEIGGQTIRMFGYNGQIPGPLLKIEQNSIILVNVLNNLDVETTVHWHGLRLDNKFDGVPGITMEALKPGESFQYELRFNDEGVYWYHPHVREDYQQELGLYGNMLVSPTEDDYYNNANKEIPIILDDILIEDDGMFPSFKDYANHALNGRFGNIMLINGDDNYNLEVTTGEVVRFYITNVASTRVFNFSIPNTRIKLIGSDIGSYEKEEFVDSVIISSAERYTIEVLFDKAGEYEFKSITPENEYTLGKIKVSGEPVTLEDDFSGDFYSLRENKYVTEDINNFRQYFDKEVDVNIKLSFEVDSFFASLFTKGDSDSTDNDWDKVEVGGSDRINWEDSEPRFNKDTKTDTIKWLLKDTSTGKKNTDIDLNFQVGDKVKIRIFNDSSISDPSQHPIHFHGQRFLVLNKNGVESKNLVWKDTVLVPIGSYVDILLDISNPGEWMAHCHIAEHLTSGMMMFFKVTEN
ncbi:multicopper oxidase family protein [Patescibacteria group bacterium]|nr:multicopper oxidase family protein [Patescibacteria group bacterium]